MNTNPEIAVVAVDGPDVDNVASMIAGFNRYRYVFVLLTGRPVNFNTSDVNDRSSIPEQAAMIQRINGLRFFKAAAAYGYGPGPRVGYFDGGIAPHTLVPHTKHFDERQFGDLTPDEIKRVENGYTVLQPIEQLVYRIGYYPFDIFVGGPMTGVKLLAEAGFNPGLQRLFAMYGVIDPRKLMPLGAKGAPREEQFNVACDAPAGRWVLENARIPVYLIPTDYTKVPGISWANPDALNQFLFKEPHPDPRFPANNHLVNLYRKWYPAALQQRGEAIVIHDVCGNVAEADPDVYTFRQVRVTDFPAGADRSKWGKISFENDPQSNIHLATGVNQMRYLQTLHQLLR